MSKHTRGPWKYNPNNNTIEGNAWYMEPSDDFEGIRIGVVCLYGTMGGNDVDADKRLIEKAPEMYDLLISIQASTEVAPGLKRIAVKLIEEINNE